MNTDKTVSIILATYNGATFIREQIDSLLAQTYPLKEIIIQDDGSRIMPSVVPSFISR